MWTRRNTLISAFLLVLYQGNLEAIETTNPKVIRALPAPFWSLADAKKDSVTYTLFQNASDKNGTNVNTQTIENAIVNKNLTTILLTHGFTADDRDPWFAEIRDNYFKIGQYNIIFLNWKTAANKQLLIALANIKPVSEFTTEFLLASKIPPERIHLIGHSLGGQLMAYVAKKIKKITYKRVDRITGLDPCAPAFEYPAKMTNKDRLYKTDARFVDVVHTNIKLYGYVEPIGHVDFYPNYGEHQIGCPSDASGNLHCSHARAPYYFAESITKKVAAVSCFLKRDPPPSTKYDVTVVPITNGKIAIFGQWVNQKTRGLYFLKTNPKQPFLKDDSL